MTIMQKIDRHANLMHRMAETVGADLGDALVSGRLSGQQVRSAVIRCSGCAHADECVGWLGDHAGGAEAAPSFCRNAGLLARLRN